MKIPLLPILSGLLVGISTMSHAADVNIKAGEYWSLDGGVFRPSDDIHRLEQSQQGTLLIKGVDGQLRSQRLGEGQRITEQLSTLQVDRQPPQVEVDWSGSITQSSTITIGPNSQMQVSSTGGTITAISLDEESISVNQPSFQHHFKTPVSQVNIKAQDQFGNVHDQTLALKSDYAAPELSWELLPPALKSDDTWHAGQVADISLQTTDDSGVSHIRINGEVVDQQLTSFQVESGAVIEVHDTLGNTHQSTVSWTEDLNEPEFQIMVNGQRVELDQRLYVKVNDLIAIQAVDHGVGLMHQKYKGKSRKWSNLPKKFRFTTKGNYRVQLTAEDAVGNQVDDRIRFKVKR